MMANLTVRAGNFDADTDYVVGTLIKLKPRAQKRFALAGAGNLATGSVTIGASGTVTIRVSSKETVLVANIIYFTDDV